MARLKALLSQPRQAVATPNATPRQPLSHVAFPKGETRDRLKLALPAVVEREVRALLVRLLPGEDHPDFGKALALALADPESHLRGLRCSMSSRCGFDEWLGLMANADFRANAAAEGSL